MRRQATAKRGTKNCSLQPRQVNRRRNKHAARECATCQLNASGLTVRNGEQRQGQPAALGVFRANCASSPPFSVFCAPYSVVCCLQTLATVTSQGTAWLQHMTTRASTARGQDKQQFQGRVRKWCKQWDLASDTAKYKLLKWVPTGSAQ